MTIDRRLLAGALGTALLVAACGGSSTASPGATAGSATAAATEAPAATDAPAGPTDEPAATEEATDEVNLGEGTNDLAATLPSQAGGVTFEKAGFDGDQLGIYGAAAGFDAGELDPILKAHGKTLDDVNFAMGTSSDGTGGMIYALQIEGVDAMEFAGAMGMDPATMPKSTMGGKTVFGESQSGFGAWAYPRGDALYIVLLASPELAEAIFQALP